MHNNNKDTNNNMIMNSKNTAPRRQEEQAAAKRRALGNKLWARLIRAVLAKAQLQQEHGCGGSGGGVVEQVGGAGLVEQGRALEGSDVEDL